MAKSPILGGFSAARAGGLADNELTNLIVEIHETKDGRTPGALYNAAGLDLVASAGPGPVRGVRDLNGLLYVVSGANVYSLNQGGTSTLCGNIGLRETPVSMFNNTTQMMIVDGIAGWLVPGGYPLSGGAISAPGGLYALNDTITLIGDTGTATAAPIITVTGVSNHPVSTLSLQNGGTGYTAASSVATTAFSGQPGVGSGLTLNITAAGGPITAATLNVGGTGYAVNDTGTVKTGTADAAYRVTTVSAGVVTGFILLNHGTNYATGTAVATASGLGTVTNSGAGLTVNTTVASGVVTSITLANGGQGYSVGAAGAISGGGGNATYLVTAIGLLGGVTAFTISTPGAVIEQPLNFNQQSTSGSGANFTLTSPTFGAYLGIVPVTLPFANPVMGAVSDGFGLLVFLGSQNIAQSNEADLATWDPLSYGVANQSPDKCIAIAVAHDEAFVLKERNTEVFVDAGSVGFAFRSLTGVHIETGCIAPFSLAKLGETLIWLARNDQGQGIVVKADGYRVQPISTQALVNQFDQYANRGDAIGYAYQQGGHAFYVITFPEANATWMYDATSSALLGVPIWSRLGAWSDGQLSRHWGNCYWSWKGGGVASYPTTSYQAKSVTITSPTTLTTASGLVGMPPSFSTALLSVWLLLPDNGTATGIIFSNAFLSVRINNDLDATPQIAIHAWDATNTSIVTATYNFTTWAAWVNVLISIDTATQVLQVYANTLVASVLVETHLSPVAITWTSSNPIAASPTQTWQLAVA